MLGRLFEDSAPSERDEWPSLMHTFCRFQALRLRTQSLIRSRAQVQFDKTKFMQMFDDYSRRTDSIEQSFVEELQIIAHLAIDITSMRQ